MTVDPARLLQLLEPAVRPGASATDRGQQAGKAPFENRSFNELLSDLHQQAGAANESASQPEESRQASHRLSGLDRIENAALRSVLAKARTGLEG